MNHPHFYFLITQ